jgi:hypothetical protein
LRSCPFHEATLGGQQSFLRCPASDSPPRCQLTSNCHDSESICGTTNFRTRIGWSVAASARCLIAQQDRTSPFAWIPRCSQIRETGCRNIPERCVGAFARNHPRIENDATPQRCPSCLLASASRLINRISAPGMRLPAVAACVDSVTSPADKNSGLRQSVRRVRISGLRRPFPYAIAEWVGAPTTSVGFSCVSSSKMSVRVIM